ncbi:hypothetical protein KKC17_03390 [Patescibacteria group bacterium]|nr:hypothetical protein [Patescibacteria group bacterium]
MAKISDIYHLNKTQRELDFVNINIDRDFPVYLNPFIFSARPDPFSIDAIRTISGFFQFNLELIRNGQIDQARANFQHLNEPNETCLGMSRRSPRGRGVGEENADDLFDSISTSRAVASGLVEHLEDTAIFIEGIGKDKVSDMTTNIIRANLIAYTQAQCALHGIPMTTDVPSGFFWDATNRRWEQVHTEMLVVNYKKILLVPKAVVSYVKEFNHGKYHQHYALEFLQDDHLRRNTPLVQTTHNKDGSVRRRFVTKKDLIQRELTSNKEELIDFTRRHPEVFNNFRTGAASQVFPMNDSELESIDVNQLINHLIARLGTIKSGDATASAYHTLMVGILEFIFYPNLINPVKELEINQGRKRIDIAFDNGAPSDGFFYRLQHAFSIPCPYIFIECKNYSKDIRNPELDQMVGRFSPNRGRFGIIVCRDIDDEDVFLKRCADSYKDQHGLIIPLTDADLINILNQKKAGIEHPEDEILSQKARRVMNS